MFIFKNLSNTYQITYNYISKIEMIKEWDKMKWLKFFFIY